VMPRGRHHTGCGTTPMTICLGFQQKSIPGVSSKNPKAPKLIVTRPTELTCFINHNVKHRNVSSGRRGVPCLGVSPEWSPKQWICAA